MEGPHTTSRGTVEQVGLMQHLQLLRTWILYACPEPLQAASRLHVLGMLQANIPQSRCEEGQG